VAVLIALWASACGSSITDSSSLLDPSQVRSIVPAFDVATAGVAPQVLHLNAPVTVTFTNQDAMAHRFEAAPELGYGACPEMAQLSDLEPGHSGTVMFARTELICAFHDAAAPTNKAFQGIVVLH
jgi:hypothetical protein